MHRERDTERESQTERESTKRHWQRLRIEKKVVAILTLLDRNRRRVKCHTECCSHIVLIVP